MHIGKYVVVLCKIILIILLRNREILSRLANLILWIVQIKVMDSVKSFVKLLIKQLICSSLHSPFAAHLYNTITVSKHYLQNSAKLNQKLLPELSGLQAQQDAAKQELLMKKDLLLEE